MADNRTGSPTTTMLRYEVSTRACEARQVARFSHGSTAQLPLATSGASHWHKALGSLGPSASEPLHPKFRTPTLATRATSSGLRIAGPAAQRCTAADIRLLNDMDTAPP